jgi:hypothetical protein
MRPASRKLKNVLLLCRRDAHSRDFSDFRGCGQWQRRSDVVLAFSNICDKMSVDLHKGLDEAGLFESYLGKCPRHPAIRP